MDNHIDRPVEANGLPAGNGHAGDQDAIAALTLVVSHLAAQLTMTQIRLRALASALEASGSIDPSVVQGHVAEIADHQTGFYLRENLGEALANMIEVDNLAREIMEFMGKPE